VPTGHSEKLIWTKKYSLGLGIIPDPRYLFIKNLSDLSSRCPDQIK